MARRRTLLATLAVLAVLAVMAGPAPAQAPRDKATLKLNFYAYGGHAAFAYGLEKGIYAEDGIELAIVEGGGSGKVGQEVGIGSERFGYADATTMANLVSNGLPVKMITNSVKTSLSPIIFFAETGIKSPRDLEGKKVSFTAGDSLHQNFPALIKLNRVDKSKVQEGLLAPAAKQTAVRTGTVDAMGGYYTTQAGLIESETKKKVGYIRYTDFGVGAMTQGLFVHTKHLGEKSLNCRMVRATGRAWQAAMKDPDGAVAALHKLFPKTNKGLTELTKKEWLDSADLLYTKSSQGKTPGLMMKEDWDTLLSLAKGYGGLEPVKAHRDYYTNEF